MEVTGSQLWIQAARAAAQALKAARPEPPQVPDAKNYPATPPAQTGLRGLEQTQSIDQYEKKGRIINRYL